ncbi:hypothetical protein AB6N23_01070 [Cellulomonas sp. 179-A 9B4 NHS]|uniref:hypothetical protein n=1 Tax=Cellulomonas sp. 179-A 9B4 NHS TaxID=3142379 RepID=UPI0039A1D9DA
MTAPDGTVPSATTDGEGARPRRRRLRGLVVAAVAVALAVGTGITAGSTVALWRDRETFSVRMPAGVVAFGARTVTAPATATDWATGTGDPVEAVFGPGQAATLYDTGSAAVLFQVDSLAQGHRGLRYTVTPTVSGGVFGAATLRLFTVTSPALCVPGATGTPATASTPWQPGYSTATALRAEYWCLVATFDKVRGAYANTASVVGDVQTSTGTVTDAVRAQASWAAQVLKAINPATEPAHRLTFRYETFRGPTP